MFPQHMLSPLLFTDCSKSCCTNWRKKGAAFSSLLVLLLGVSDTRILGAEAQNAPRLLLGSHLGLGMGRVMFSGFSLGFDRICRDVEFAL